MQSVPLFLVFFSLHKLIKVWNAMGLILMIVQVVIQQILIELIIMDLQKSALANQEQ